MYCRKCIKKGKKVSMAVLVEEQAYACPECNEKIEWSGQDGENEQVY